MSKDEQSHPAYRFGTDDQFLEWVSYQPSVIDGSYNQYSDNEGEPRNIACHVRRLSRGAGRGIKPKYSAVAMSDSQHKLQESADGEMKVLNLYWVSGRNNWTREQAAKWFEDAAEEMLTNWIAHRQAEHNKKFQIHL